MKRWDPAIAYLGSGEYAPDMEACDDGEYVLHADAMELLNAANANTLAAMRREKAALDQVEALRAVVAAKDAEIKRLNDVIGEMSE